MSLTTKTVSGADLRSWMEGDEVTYASSSRERKSITSNKLGLIRVWGGSGLLYEGNNPEKAARIYNEYNVKYVSPHQRF